MKRILKEYFTFSKKERVAMIILLLLIGLFMAAPYFYSVKPKPPLLNKELQHFISQQKNAPENYDSTIRQKTFVKSTGIENKAPRKLFYFDPNTVSGDGWKQLGIADKTIKTILNYRNKGGRFKSADDIRKIWGLKKEDADAIIPYVQIAETVSIQNVKPNPTQYLKTQPLYKKQPTTIDINTASVEEWQTLPGVGEVLANRIIKFRDRLGGFKDIDQLRKTYGISDSVFLMIAPYLRLQNSRSSEKLDLNKASMHDFKMKLGLSESVARSIIVFRQQYGPFLSVEALKKIVFITDTLYERIAPNLVVE